MQFIPAALKSIKCLVIKPSKLTSVVELLLTWFSNQSNTIKLTWKSSKLNTIKCSVIKPLCSQTQSLLKFDWDLNIPIYGSLYMELTKPLIQSQFRQVFKLFVRSCHTTTLVYPRYWNVRSLLIFVHLILFFFQTK